MSPVTGLDSGSDTLLPEWVPELLKGVPEFPSLLTLDEQLAALESLCKRHGSLLRRQTLGRSADRRPMEMLSVGTGSRGVLVVGGPHPNEPVGGLTIASLLQILTANLDRWHHLDCTFHFIPCIDPDGLARNVEWISQPLSIKSYLEHFFRPAMRLQPEYSFPLETNGYRFDSPTPENLAWQQALRSAQPTLQVSLHNSDLGGAFFLMSSARPRLAEQFRQLTVRHALPLSKIGEPLAELPPHAPGIFGFPDIAALVGGSTADGASGGWDAGDSSEGFGRRVGIFSVVPEVPLWRLHPAGDSMPNVTTVADVLAKHLERCRRLAALFSTYLSPCINGAPGDDFPWVTALREIDRQTTRQTGMLSAMLSRSHPALQETMAAVDSVSMDAQLAMFSLRAAAMLRSLSRRRGQTEAVVACDGFTVEGMDELDETATLEPASLRELVSIQAGAVLLAASHC